MKAGIEKFVPVLMVAALLGGCHAEDATNSNKDPVVTPPAKVFAMGGPTQDNNQHFSANNVFLWSQPLVPAVGAIVIRAGNEYDKSNDAAIVEAGLINQTGQDLGTAKDALTGAITDDPTKNAVNAYTAVMDTQTDPMGNTASELDTIIAKTEGDLKDLNDQVSGTARALPRDAQDTLSKLGQLGATRARLDQADPQRAQLQQQIDDLNKTLPTSLPDLLATVKSERDAKITTLEGNYRDHAAALLVPQQIADAAKAIPALAPDAKAKMAELDRLYSLQNDQVRAKVQYGFQGENLVKMIKQNTDYFDSSDMEFNFNFSMGGAHVDITSNKFPFKFSPKFSTEDGSVDHVSYKQERGVIIFDVHAEGPDMPFYRFKLGRTHLVNVAGDDRIFYQGEMNLCKVGSDCNAKWGQVLRHGIAKLVSHQ